MSSTTVTVSVSSPVTAGENLAVSSQQVQTLAQGLIYKTSAILVENFNTTTPTTLYDTTLNGPGTAAAPWQVMVIEVDPDNQSSAVDSAANTPLFVMISIRVAAGTPITFITNRYVPLIFHRQIAITGAVPTSSASQTFPFNASPAIINQVQAINPNPAAGGANNIKIALTLLY